jgi:hypothetical protein
VGHSDGSQLSSSATAYSDAAGTLSFTHDLESDSLVSCEAENDSCHDAFCETSVGDFSDQLRSSTPDQQLDAVTASSREQCSPDVSVVHHRQPSIAMSQHTVGSADTMKAREI